jgi:hypothetical protein
VAVTLIFAQVVEAVLPLTAFVGQATARFGVTVTVLGEGAGDSGASRRVRLEVAARGARESARGVFVLEARPSTAADVARARDAELRGRAAGMGDLAARCRTVWSLAAESEAPEWLLLELCAVLAFAALGPVLPPDGATLFGVRGAREQAARLRGTS